MKKLSIMLLFSACFALAAPAQTFKETFKEFIKTQSDNLLPSEIPNLIKGFTGAEGKTALAGRYAKEQLLDDMADVVAPYFEDKLTEKDMKEITKFYNEPKTKEALGRMKALTDASTGKQILSEFSSPITKIVMGGKPENIKLREGVSKKYRKTCNKFCKDAGFLKAIEQVEKALDKLPFPSDGKAEAILEYINENLPTFLANTGSQFVTLDDFDTLSQVFKTSAFKHFEAGKDAMLDDILNVGSKLAKKASKWNEKQKK
ncbi:MAG: DUF2059 domain-containing protein [Prevotellaceae bacterium]|nr:DUF2059 domain-containing protein [Prevotellaceae bacterium]